MPHALAVAAVMPLTPESDDSGAASSQLAAAIKPITQKKRRLVGFYCCIGRWSRVERMSALSRTRWLWPVMTVVGIGTSGGYAIGQA
jgi:hypothetical protein